MAKTKATPEDAHELAVQEREQGKLLELYNGGLPYDRRLLISQVKVLTQSAFENIVEAGKRLILLKEFEGHGNFMNVCEEIGIERQMAQNFMNVAVKLGNYKALGNFGKSKLYLIANNLTDDEIAKADEAGTFDKYEKMSWRQLQEELRKRDADRKDKKDAQGRLIDRLNKEIEKLRKENETAKLGFPEAEEAQEKALMVEILKFDGILSMLSTIDIASLSPRMRARVIGAHEYIEKYALIEMLKVKQDFDPGEEVFDGEVDMAEQKKVGGGWDEKMAGLRNG